MMQNLIRTKERVINLSTKSNKKKAEYYERGARTIGIYFLLFFNKHPNTQTIVEIKPPFFPRNSETLDFQTIKPCLDS